MTVKTAQNTVAAAAAAALLLCCGFVRNASAQSDDDIWDYNESSAPAAQSFSDTWDYSEEPEPPPAAPAKAAKTKAEKPPKAPKAEKAPKPEKAPKAEKAPKPEKAPKAAAASKAVSSDDGVFNIFAGAGAGFGIGGEWVGASNKYNGTKTAARLEECKDHYLNLGEGLRLELGAGITIAHNVEARVSGDFNIGIFAPRIETIYNMADPPQVDQGRTDITEHSFFTWGIKAMIVPKFEMLELFDMYAGAGLCLNFAYASYNDTVYANTTPIQIRNYERKFSPGFGFCGVIGGLIPFSDRFVFFAELQFEAVRFKLNENTLTGTPIGPAATSDFFEENSTRDPAPPYFPGTSWSLRAGAKFWIM